MLPAATIRTAIEERLFAEDLIAKPIRWTPASGGLSNASVCRVQQGQTAFAIRRWWKGIDPAYVAWIHTTLNELADSGLAFVAAPLTEGDTWPLIDAMSDRWEAAKWKAGVPLEASSGGSAIGAAIEGLVAFHQRICNRGECPAMRPSSFTARAARLRGLVVPPPYANQLVAGTFPELNWIAKRLPSAAREAGRLLEHGSRTEPPLQPIHGDARPEHFLLQGDRLTGLIDFGAMRIDTPLADLARFAGELAGGDADRRDSLVEAYADAAGTTAECRAVAALDLSGAVLSGANWLRWLNQPGGLSRDPLLVRQRLRSILARLEVL